MMPSDLIVSALTKEVNLRIKGFGSMSLNLSDLQQGSEPHLCFYMQNIDSIFCKKMRL